MHPKSPPWYGRSSNSAEAKSSSCVLTLACQVSRAKTLSTVVHPSASNSRFLTLPFQAFKCDTSRSWRSQVIRLCHGYDTSHSMESTICAHRARSRRRGWRPSLPRRAADSVAFSIPRFVSFCHIRKLYSHHRSKCIPVTSDQSL